MKNSSYENLHEIFKNCDQSKENSTNTKASNSNLKCILIKLPNLAETEISELEIKLTPTKIKGTTNSNIPKSISKQRKSIPMRTSIPIKTLNVYDFSKSVSLEYNYTRKTPKTSLNYKTLDKKQVTNSDKLSIIYH